MNMPLFHFHRTVFFVQLTVEIQIYIKLPDSNWAQYIYLNSFVITMMDNIYQDNGPGLNVILSWYIKTAKSHKCRSSQATEMSISRTFLVVFLVPGVCVVRRGVIVVSWGWNVCLTCIFQNVTFLNTFIQEFCTGQY